MMFRRRNENKNENHLQNESRSALYRLYLLTMHSSSSYLLTCLLTFSCCSLRMSQLTRIFSVIVASFQASEFLRICFRNGGPRVSSMSQMRTEITKISCRTQTAWEKITLVTRITCRGGGAVMFCWHLGELSWENVWGRIFWGWKAGGCYMGDSRGLIFYWENVWAAFLWGGMFEGGTAMGGIFRDECPDTHAGLPLYIWRSLFGPPKLPQADRQLCFALQKKVSENVFIISSRKVGRFW